MEWEGERRGGVEIGLDVDWSVSEKSEAAQEKENGPDVIYWAGMGRD